MKSETNDLGGGTVHDVKQSVIEAIADLFSEDCEQRGIMIATVTYKDGLAKFRLVNGCQSLDIENIIKEHLIKVLTEDEIKH